MGEEPKNENKPEFKGNLGFIWLIGILVILLGCVTVYTLKITADNKELKQAQPLPQPAIQTPVTTQEQTKTENTTTVTTEEAKKVAKKLDSSKELVYTYESRKSKKNDKYSYSFQIPYVNINSDYAEEINKEIKRKYSNLDQLVKWAKEAPADETSFVSYKTYINNNILSLVIIESGGHPDIHYVYNIDIYTGKKITNADLLDIKNISETKFINKVEELCTNAINKLYKNVDYGDKDDCLARTLEKNANMKIQMFLDNNNKINIIPDILNDIAQWNNAEQIINTKL